MTMIQLIACAGMIAGLFMVLNISPREMSESIFSRLTTAPGSIRADINETTKRKKAGFFRREISEAQAVLAASGREGKFPLVCMTSLLLFALGACIAILAGNAFLVPVLAVGMMLVPFWYVKLTAGGFKKDVAAELETALSVITTAYLRTENFQQAVEENVRYLHHPVQEVFQRFLTRIKHIDPDLDAALDELKNAIDNEVWREWCEAVSACQADRSLKTTLPPIVAKLSDMRVVNGELENLVYGPRKEFITMAILVIINIPLVRFINKDWYHTLTGTLPGQAVIALCIAAVFVCFAFVIKLTQPIEYRR
ncbi:MAG: type II secretion system F family protein [Candidatus Limivicinus sp.]